MLSTFRLQKVQQFSPSRRHFGTNWSAVRHAVKKFGAPESIGLIEDECLASPNAVAFIREIGCTRRVFLLNPHFTSDELEGLEYRIRTLTRNTGINSVLIANDHRLEHHGALPSMMLDRDQGEDYQDDVFFSPESGNTRHLASGYDPLQLYKSGKHTNRAYVNTLLQRLTDLTTACAGHAKNTKVPTICIPHGAITDGGYAFLRSSYVLCTKESTFRILNPSRGLSLDPVGLSYYLTRLGQEFEQTAAAYPGCGLLLALAGYEANAGDMLEMGMATHSIDNTSGLGSLEETLAELPSWEGQGLLKNPKRYHGQEIDNSMDHNAFFRNYVVADCIDTFAVERADGKGIFSGYSEENLMRHNGYDPSLDPDATPLFTEERCSMLLNYAATFDALMQSHRTVQGLVDGLREIGSRRTNDPLEQEGIDVAADLAARLQRQSPLAVSVIHQLLLQSQRHSPVSSKEEVLQMCMKRERWAQTNMFQQEDFARWAQYTLDHPAATEPFTNWKHKSFADVTEDEVEEILAVPEGETVLDNNFNNNNMPPATALSPHLQSRRA